MESKGGAKSRMSKPQVQSKIQKIKEAKKDSSKIS